MMLLERRYRTLEFEELKPFPCDGLIMYAVRIVHVLISMILTTLKQKVGYKESFVCNFVVCVECQLYVPVGFSC